MARQTSLYPSWVIQAGYVVLGGVYAVVGWMIYSGNVGMGVVFGYILRVG